MYCQSSNPIQQNVNRKVKRVRCICGSQDLTIQTLSSVVVTSSCTRYFPKSRLNATFQMVINGTNPELWSVFHIEALWRGNILARYSESEI